MKRYILVVLMLVCTLAFASCGHNHMQNNICDVCNQTSCAHQQNCNTCGLQNKICGGACVVDSLCDVCCQTNCNGHHNNQTCGECGQTICICNMCDNCGLPQYNCNNSCTKGGNGNHHNGGGHHGYHHSR